MRAGVRGCAWVCASPMSGPARPRQSVASSLREWMSAIEIHSPAVSSADEESVSAGSQVSASETSGDADAGGLVRTGSQDLREPRQDRQKADLHLRHAQLMMPGRSGVSQTDSEIISAEAGSPGSASSSVVPGSPEPV